MKNLITSAAVALGLLASAGAASASILYATGFNDVNLGTVNAPGPLAGRDDPANALGAPDDIFYSLGLGGSIDLTFGQTFNIGQDVTVYEVTFNPGKHFEEVEVYSVLGGAATLAGTITNDQAQNGSSIRISAAFDEIRLVDITPDTSTSFDGFDLDAVGLAAVPLPASALLLLAGIGGMAAMRRRNA